MMDPILQQILDETPQDLRLMMRKHAKIVLRIKELMAEKSMSQKELAEKVGKKPSEISKWLKVGHNMTLRSMVKIEAALQDDVINVPEKRSFDSREGLTFSRKTKFTVSKSSSYHRKETHYTFVSTKQAPTIFKKLA